MDCALVVAGIALGVALVALPTVFQLLWGKPRVNVILGTHYVNGQNGQAGKCLDCRIANPPVKRRVLRRIGVFRRPADGLSATISIQESTTASVIEVRTMEHTVSLPSSREPELIFDVARFDYDSKTTTTAPADQPRGFQRILAEGVYHVAVRVSTTETKVEEYGKFSVGSVPEDLHWERM